MAKQIDHPYESSNPPTKGRWEKLKLMGASTKKSRPYIQNENKGEPKPPRLKEYE